MSSVSFLTKFFWVLIVGDDGNSFFALSIVSLIKLQYKSIDLLASSFPGIGNSIPSGFEFVSKIAIIGIFNFIDSLTGPSGFLPDGEEEGNTAYWNGSEWVVNNSNLYNDGTNVMIGTTEVEGSAALNVTSENQGILIPRLTMEQRDAIATPVAGLLVFQTNETPGFYYYDGSVWLNLAGSNSNTGSSSGSGSSNNTLIYTADGF